MSFLTIASLKDKMHKRLTRKFYTQPTLKVAKDLLGKYIVRKIGKNKLVGKIIETEAYIGPKDKASHAYNGKKTARNEAEFLVGGHIYIYLVYGMYWQMNISTSKTGSPECVLIRAVDLASNSRKISNFQFPISKQISNFKLQISKSIELTNGPGKLCRWLKLDESFYGEDLTKSKRIWLENRGDRIKPSQIKIGPRIGIDYAGPFWSKRKWRFLIKDFTKHLPNGKSKNKNSSG